MPRVSVEYRTASKDVYDRFCQENPDIKIGYTEWCNILYTFSYNFRDSLLETGDRGKLPWGLGNFAVTKKKRQRIVKLPDGTEKINLPVDWKKTKEAGKYIYHMNFHTNGYKFKWKWFIGSARFYKCDVWSFKPSRVSSRMLKHYIMQEGYQHKYKEWELLKY